VVSLPEAPVLRSFLYGPGSNERILSKILTAGADAVILDLEDAVAPAHKDRAREVVGQLVREQAAEAACQVHVRINPEADGFSHLDVEGVVHSGLDAIRLPKCESPEPIAALDGQLMVLEAERGLAAGHVRLYPTIESVAGLDRARDLAAASPRVAALAFGPSDFAADLGLPGGDDRDATLFARSSLVVASRLAGIAPPVDGAYPALDDPEGLETLARWTRSLGFVGKSAIHPRQLEILHRVFTPTDDEVAAARRVVESLDDDHATAVVDGGFVDPAIVARARATLRLIDNLPSKG
jgi:citrate lyase subunit beta / citryl-CoA lyase